MNIEYTDEELVEKSKKDISFFGDLFTRYEKKLLYYILRISNFSYETAEEILQESFIKAWENLNSFDKDLKFSTWIYRIVHNTTLSEWRKTTTKGRDLKVSLELDVFKNIPDSFNIEEDFQKRLSEKEIQKILEKLDIKYKEVLVLKFLEEKSYEEISDILRKPVGTISTLINRAKKQFKAKSEKEDFFM